MDVDNNDIASKAQATEESEESPTKLGGRSVERGCWQKMATDGWPFARKPHTTQAGLGGISRTVRCLATVPATVH